MALVHFFHIGFGYKQAALYIMVRNVIHMTDSLQEKCQIHCTPSVFIATFANYKDFSPIRIGTRLGKNRGKYILSFLLSRYLARL